jgi:hypothetical protein
MVDNVVDMDAFKLARLILKCWEDAYSDNGHIWRVSNEAMELALKFAPQEVQDEAYRIANNMWGGA